MGSGAMGWLGVVATGEGVIESRWLRLTLLSFCHTINTSYLFIHNTYHPVHTYVDYYTSTIDASNTYTISNT